MNERIKELERQATETVKCGLNGTSTTESFNRKKFAKLIINECLRMCDCAEASLLEHSYPRESDGAASVKIFIKEHFGVE